MHKKRNKTKEENDILIKKIKSEKITNFRGFIFSQKFNINEIINYKYEKLNFSEVIFEKEADFSDYEFEEDVIFNKVEFKENVKFKNASFIGNCEFYKIKFNKKFINEKVFERVRFKGQNLIINKVENLPRLDGIRFSGCSKFILRNVEYNKGEYLYGKINYRIARNQSKDIGDYENIGYYYYKERTYGGKIIKESDYPTYNEYICAKFFDKLSKYTIGYGEKPWNILIITILIISIFAFFYMFAGIQTINSESIGIDISNLNKYSLESILDMYIDLWYFSMVTFSTVGYGDMIVNGLFGKILVSLEVFFGVTMGATWASVVIKRMIR